MTPATPDEPVTRNYRVERVRLANLRIDPSYHDPSRFQEARARRIGAHFDERKAGVITISDRGNDDLVIIDGLHRVKGAMQAGERWLLAKVFYGLTRADEADIFMGLQDGVALRGLHLWRTRRVQGDPVVLGIELILARHGVVVGTGGSGQQRPDITRAVATLERTYETDVALFDEVIGLCRTIWPNEPRALDAIPLQGIASFLYCYRRTTARLRKGHLEGRLEVTPPEEIIRANKAQAAAGRGKYGTGRSRASSAGVGVISWTTPRLAVLALYNHKLQTRRLPDLSISDLRAIREGRVVVLADE